MPPSQTQSPVDDRPMVKFLIGPGHLGEDVAKLARQQGARLVNSARTPECGCGCSCSPNECPSQRVHYFEAPDLGSDNSERENAIATGLLLIAGPDPNANQYVEAEPAPKPVPGRLWRFGDGTGHLSPGRRKIAEALGATVHNVYGRCRCGRQCGATCPAAARHYLTIPHRSNMESDQLASKILKTLIEPTTFAIDGWT